MPTCWCRQTPQFPCKMGPVDDTVYSLQVRVVRHHILPTGQPVDTAYYSHYYAFGQDCIKLRYFSFKLSTSRVRLLWSSFLPVALPEILFRLKFQSFVPPRNYSRFSSNAGTSLRLFLLLAATEISVEKEGGVSFFLRTLQYHIDVFSYGVQGSLVWAPMMQRGARLSVRLSVFFQNLVNQKDSSLLFLNFLFVRCNSLRNLF